MCLTRISSGAEPRLDDQRGRTEEIFGALRELFEGTVEQVRLDGLAPGNKSEFPLDIAPCRRHGGGSG